MTLDRLGRSLLHLIDTLAELQARQVRIRSLQESIDTTTAGGRLVFHVFAALAEFERDLIREPHPGWPARRPRPRPPVMTAEKLAVARQLYDANQHTTAEIAQLLDVSRTSLYRHLRQRRVRALPTDATSLPADGTRAGQG